MTRECSTCSKALDSLIKDAQGAPVLYCYDKKAVRKIKEGPAAKPLLVNFPSMCDTMRSDDNFCGPRGAWYRPVDPPPEKTVREDPLVAAIHAGVEPRRAPYRRPNGTSRNAR